MSIPKAFHVFWDGPPAPRYVRESMDSWKEMHPDWRVIRWDERSGRAALPYGVWRSLWDRSHEVSPKSNTWQFRTNLLRLIVLHETGGVWVDADLQALRNVEPLIEGATAFTSRESERFVNNGFTGCEPGDPWYAAMVDAAPSRILTRRNARSNVQCGPHLYTETIRRFEHVRVLPTELIYPVPRTDLGGLGSDHPEAYTVHHWNNQQKRNAAR